MSLHETTVITEVEFDVVVTHYVPAVSGNYSGLPENCYPDEPEELEFDVKLGDQKLTDLPESVTEAIAADLRTQLEEDYGP